MKQALVIYAAVLGGMHASYLTQGFAGTAEIAYGALAIMALMIAATFLWLWAMRMSTLSLGMAFSWMGAAMVMGWWWLYSRLGGPIWMLRSEALLVLVGAMLTGAVLHFEVIETSFGFRRGAFLLPVAGAMAVSLLLLALAV
ncbi:hypothetical protein [Tropicimonas isoalkanivorans]|uniref:Uncharacterized protein n=1 Tax=Tropicimonas isoalkanivorans TaxID=441112 RepID=A0A1I1E033_9RHOB|nr:hypothetical protein [Tropicimonas isoalkanivorans]SFB80434.1 hypothetical protein SAMN04488094_101562 [Tropicimonas isoalkanivorans]